MIKSKRFQISGTVQGVGFRPWVYRLAHQLHLKGFVQNTSRGVCMEIEGSGEDVDRFVDRIQAEAPVHCVITKCDLADIAPQGFKQFKILTSYDDQQHQAIVLPDMASCPECMKEVFDRHDRRYLYPFTNCTHCGPRYSIIESLPYDRSNTSMKKFKMCERCQQEYDDPLNRRFHAEPNVCPTCGPNLFLCDDQGDIITSPMETLSAAAGLIKNGAILAVKGLGGFHLMADALNEEAVAVLRQRKHRPHKPFALMMPSVKIARQYCTISSLEEKLLRSAQAPIVLLRKANDGLRVAQVVAPDNPYLGCMLPVMPLHHILLKMLNRPIVATSANLSEEPICIDNLEAFERLKGIADFFLVHDRPIVRHVDDSIVQVMADEPCLLRRSRGFAPLPIDVGRNCEGILATGGHQKNTVALGLGTSVIISQHIGDLNNIISFDAFEKTIASLRGIYDAPVNRVACDAHPDYVSSQYARDLGVEVVEIQHHHAHVASCIAERGLPEEVLGVCWDGTGYGRDGTIWGGEFLVCDAAADFQRLAHLELFPLPGGEQAIKEPRRSALGLLYGLCEGDWGRFSDLPCVQAFEPHELTIIQRMIKQQINIPMTSSMGRLFDGIASILGLCHRSTFEGQAAMALEFLAVDQTVSVPYTYRISASNVQKGSSGIDFSSMIREIIADLRSGCDKAVISGRVHQTLVEIIIDVARLSSHQHIVLTGGCFQNKWLLEAAIKRLKEEQFIPSWHSQVPANDGGIALGQVYIASRR